MTPDRFLSLTAQGMIRLCAATPRASAGYVAANVSSILEQAREASTQGADLVLYPELCVSSYAIDDLHLQDAMVDAVEAGIGQLVDASVGLKPVLVVGAPLRRGGRLYNCAVVIARGRLLGVVP